MGIDLAAYGLSVQDEKKARRRDAVLIRMARLWRDGIRPRLPRVGRAR